MIQITARHRYQAEEEADRRQLKPRTWFWKQKHERVLVSHVWVPGNPRAKGRPRLMQGGQINKDGTIRKPRIYTPSETIAAEERIGWLVKEDMADRGTAGEPDVSHQFAFEIALHEFKTEARQVDVDNAAKLILDALNGIVFKDDNQVSELHVWMRDRESREPHTEITIYRLEI